MVIVERFPNARREKGCSVRFLPHALFPSPIDCQSIDNLLSFAPSLKDLFDRGEKVQVDRTNRLRNTETTPTS